jgi:hypothetical protein
MISEPLIVVMTRRIPQAMSGHWQGKQRGDDDDQWPPQGAIRLSGCRVRPLDKGSAIFFATCLATREPERADMMRIDRTGQ